MCRGLQGRRRVIKCFHCGRMFSMRRAPGSLGLSGKYPHLEARQVAQGKQRFSPVKC